MDSHPYTYGDASNPRLVTNIQDTNGKVMGATGFLYVASMSSYMRKVFRVNNDPLKLGLFAALALPASYAYAQLVFDSAEN